MRDAGSDPRAAETGRRRRLAPALPLLVLAALFGIAYRQVLGITQRPSWPPPPDAVTSAGARGRDRGVRRARRHAAARRRARVRVVDGGDDRAVGRGRELLPADLRRRRGRALVGAHPDVRLARGRGRQADGGAARAQAGRGRRGAGDRRRARLAAVRAGARDVHAASPRRARRSSSTTCSRPTATGSSPTTSTLDWRQDEVGRADHRKLYVIDGAVAWTGGAGIEDHFENGGFHDVMVRVTGDVVRQAQAAFLTSFHGHGGPLPADLAPLLPRAGRPRHDPDRAGAGDPRRLRRRLAGDPRADRRGARAARRDEPVPHRPRHDRAHPRRRPARREGARRRLGEVQQRAGDGRAQAPLRRPDRRPASRSGSSRAPSSTPRSWSPTTSSASAPSTSTRGRSIATPRS